MRDAEVKRAKNTAARELGPDVASKSLPRPKRDDRKFQPGRAAFAKRHRLIAVRFRSKLMPAEPIPLHRSGIGRRDRLALPLHWFHTGRRPFQKLWFVFHEAKNGAVVRRGRWRALASSWSARRPGRNCFRSPTSDPGTCGTRSAL